jgi:hypothetical protein
MVNDVLHGERIVDATAARVRSTIHRRVRDDRVDRSNLQKSRSLQF